MSDLISRQAAIAHAVPLNLFGREVMMVPVSELENLPSVQSEPAIPLYDEKLYERIMQILDERIKPERFFDK